MLFSCNASFMVPFPIQFIERPSIRQIVSFKAKNYSAVTCILQIRVQVISSCTVHTYRECVGTAIVWNLKMFQTGIAKIPP